MLDIRTGRVLNLKFPTWSGKTREAHRSRTLSSNFQTFPSSTRIALLSIALSVFPSRISPPGSLYVFQPSCSSVFGSVIARSYQRSPASLASSETICPAFRLLICEEFAQLSQREMKSPVSKTTSRKGVPRAAPTEKQTQFFVGVGWAKSDSVCSSNVPAFSFTLTL